MFLLFFEGMARRATLRLKDLPFQIVDQLLLPKGNVRISSNYDIHLAHNAPTRREGLCWVLFLNDFMFIDMNVLCVSV